MKKFLMLMGVVLVLCGCDKSNVDNTDYSQVATNLYNKYIKYSELDINAYNDINVNEDSSNEYMVKLAIYNILNDNNVNIDDYNFANDVELEEGYSRGYKITTSQIENYISKLFNVNKTINYKELELNFNDDISAHYYGSEGAYRLIDSTSIPASNATFKAYSKLVDFQKYENDIMIYTQYFGIVSEMSDGLIASTDNDAIIYELCSENCPSGDPIEYVLNNLSNEIGGFKHTFTKKSDGNYYWVSTVGGGYSPFKEARGEAAMIVSGVNNYCALAEMKELLNGTTNICSDGVTVEEIKDNMVDIPNYVEILDVKFEDKRVKYLKVKTYNTIVEYNGTDYELVK